MSGRILGSLAAMMVSMSCLAADIPTEVLGQDQYDMSMCIDSETNNCITTVCMNSEDTDCQDNCSEQAQDQCQDEAE